MEGCLAEIYEGGDHLLLLSQMSPGSRPLEVYKDLWLSNPDIGTTELLEELKHHWMLEEGQVSEKAGKWGFAVN